MAQNFLGSIATPLIERAIVTTDQMRAIEEGMFAAGMPVAALMEKVAQRLEHRIRQSYPDLRTTFGVLVGPGHNGGDALVVARELHLHGYRVQIYCPFPKLKPLTAEHYRYAQSLAIAASDQLDGLQTCDVLIDGLFGFGLERPITGAIADAITTINQWQKPILSIDLPSGLHTDTGAVLGTAIRASRTFCLGLWKLGLLQEQALAWIGDAEWVGFDIPLADIQRVLGTEPRLQRITAASAIADLPLSRPVDTHKYQMGHVLVIAGSHRYAGAALLAGLGARASGVGMLTLAVPESLKLSLVPALPDALIVGCPETASGAIVLPESLIESIQNNRYQAIVCGPGLTVDAVQVVQTLTPSSTALLFDADALTILAQEKGLPQLLTRPAATVLTPHLGEFKRLFPTQDGALNRAIAVQQAASETGAFVLLKGARTVISDPQGQIRINPHSTPALARGGSGDVLSGLLGGLMAQAIATAQPVTADLIGAAVWWHSHAGLMAVTQRSTLGVDALTLAQFLVPSLQMRDNTAPESLVPGV